MTNYEHLKKIINSKVLVTAFLEENAARILAYSKTKDFTNESWLDKEKK